MPILLRLRDVTRRTALSKSTIHNYVRAGTFPKPVKIQGNTRWVDTEVDAWIAASIENRDRIPITPQTPPLKPAAPVERWTMADVETWLLKELGGGPRARNEIAYCAHLAGIPWKAVKQAKLNLGLGVDYLGKFKACYWLSPAAQNRDDFLY